MAHILNKYGLNGLFIVAKPAGIRCAPMLNNIKAKLFKELSERTQNPLRNRDIKLGHGGTLDNDANGVLVCGIGGGTKLLTNMLGTPKVYHTRAQLGACTDTYDASGEVVERADFSHITDVDEITPHLERFCGDFMQQPPSFSALKRGGKRLSDLQRTHQDCKLSSSVHAPVEAALRPAHGFWIGATAYDAAVGQVELEMKISGGTYVRSIVNDLGNDLGCGAHTQTITRKSVGPFSLADAIDYESICIDSISASIAYTSSLGYVVPSLDMKQPLTRQRKHARRSFI